MKKRQKIMAGLMTLALIATLIPPPVLAAAGDVLSEVLTEPKISIEYLNYVAYGNIAGVREDVYWIPSTNTKYKNWDDIPSENREEAVHSPLQTMEFKNGNIETGTEHYSSLESPTASGNLIVYYTDWISGVINTKGKILYPFRTDMSYVGITMSTYGGKDYFRVYMWNADYTGEEYYVVQNEEAIPITKEEYMAVDGYHNGYKVRRLKSKTVGDNVYTETVSSAVYEIIDESGKQVGTIDCNDYVYTTYSEYTGFSEEGLMPVSKGGWWLEQENKYGYIDITGKLVIPLQYDYVRGFRNGLALVKESESAYLIDSNNNKVQSYDKNTFRYTTEVSDTGLLWYLRNDDKLGVQQLELPEKKIKLPQGIQYVPYETTIAAGGELASGSALPPGLKLENGVLSGMPTYYGTYFFTIGDKDYSLTFLQHTINNDKAIWDSNKGTSGDGVGYEIEVAIPSQDGQTVLGAPDNTWEIGRNAWYNATMEFKSAGPFGEFQRLWLNGKELKRSRDVNLSDGNDYFAQDGSTRLTIRTQTLADAGDGTHTISAEFKGASDNKLHYSTQNYQLTQSSSIRPANPNPTPSGSGSKRHDSSAPTRYSISIPTFAGGKIVAEPAAAAAGQTVKLTAVPDAGYQLEDLAVLERKGKELNLKQNSETEFTFTMPSKKVDIEAEFQQLSSSLPFWDVSAEAWYFDAVNYVYQRGLMRGVSEYSFLPDGGMNRAMLVTMLHRYSGGVEAGEKWYSAARDWAVGKGILLGDENGDLRLFNGVSWEEFLVVFYRYVGSPEVTGDLSGFDAAGVPDWAQDAMLWAEQMGLTEGFSAEALRSGAAMSRAEIATVFMRYMEQQ